MNGNEFCINEEAILNLRSMVQARLSPKRWIHTAAVEEMVARLAALYCPQKTNLLRAAALLHDLTKEWPVEKHCAFCAAQGIRLTAQDVVAHKTLHARTAAALIPLEFPAFAHPELISAVRWHTTGRPGMTLPEKLLYLADYIDASRAFPDCVLLRETFWGAEPQAMPAAERREHLRKVLVKSFDLTIAALLADGLPVAQETINARNALIMEGVKKHG